MTSILYERAESLFRKPVATLNGWRGLKQECLVTHWSTSTEYSELHENECKPYETGPTSSSGTIYTGFAFTLLSVGLNFLAVFMDETARRTGKKWKREKLTSWRNICMVPGGIFQFLGGLFILIGSLMFHYKMDYKFGVKYNQHHHEHGVQECWSAGDSLLIAWAAAAFTILGSFYVLFGSSDLIIDSENYLPSDTDVDDIAELSESHKTESVVSDRKQKSDSMKSKLSLRRAKSYQPLQMSKTNTPIKEAKSCESKTDTIESIPNINFKRTNRHKSWLGSKDSFFEEQITRVLNEGDMNQAKRIQDALINDTSVVNIVKKRTKSDFVNKILN